MKTAKRLIDIIEQSKGQGTKPYDTQAEVVRVEGDTLWCHFIGGIDETPVEKTISASVGDTVQVRVSGGRAWVTGNASAPPTDDKEVIRVEKKVEKSIQQVQAATDNLQEQIDNIEISGDENQYFWHVEEGTDTGSHITEIPKDDFIANPSGFNILIRSIGFAIRNAMTELAQFTSSLVRLGNSNSRHVEISLEGMSYYPNGENPSVRIGGGISTIGTFEGDGFITTRGTMIGITQNEDTDYYSDKGLIISLGGDGIKHQNFRGDGGYSSSFGYYMYGTGIVLDSVLEITALFNSKIGETTKEVELRLVTTWATQTISVGDNDDPWSLAVDIDTNTQYITIRNKGNGTIENVGGRILFESSTINKRYFTFGEGVNADPDGNNQVAIGEYNVAYPDSLFEIGNGSLNYPANVFTVFKGGRIEHGGEFNTESVNSSGNISAGGNISAEGDINCDNITAEATLTAMDIVAYGDISGVGNITTSGYISGDSISSSNSISSGGDIDATGNITASGELQDGDGNILSEMNIFKRGETFATGNVQCAGYVTNSSKSLEFFIPLPRSLTDSPSSIATLTISNNRLTARGINGYVGGSQYLSTSGLEIVNTPRATGLQLRLNSTTALTNVTNNTPITVLINVTFTMAS